MTTPSNDLAPAVPDEGVPLTFDDDGPSGEIEFKSTDELQADFESGMLGADDFEQPQRKPEDYGADEGVPVFPVELPPTLDSDAPVVEQMMDRLEAAAFLDQLVGHRDWRKWRPMPPWHHVF